MDATQEQRIRDFVEIANGRLADCKISLRKYDAERRCLERMMEGTQPCSPENLYTVGRGLWKLVTEDSKKEGRQDTIDSFWHALITDLHRRFPRANTGEQWVELQPVPEPSQFAKWKTFLDRWILPPNPLALSPEVTAALEPYRKQLIREFHEISLSGFGGASAQSDAEGKAELVRIYVDLDLKVAPELPAEDQIRIKVVLLLLTGVDVIPALEWLARDPRRVLIGLPGSGKSTLLKFFGLCLAHCGLKPDAEWLKHLKPWPKEETDLVPVFVELRQFAASLPATLPAVDGGQHLTNYLLAQLKPSPLEECADALRKALVAGRAIVFLDGLDEVPDEDKLRRFVLDSVEAFARGPFKESRMVVTCRPRSYDDPAWQLRGFKTAQVAELDAPKIDRFINQFYAEVARHDRRVADVKADRIAKLKLAVRREELQDLAANPFMLTVMAWLHRFEELPRKRALILHRLVEQLLFKWEETKRRDEGTQGPKLSELLKKYDLDVTSVRRVLCRLAFQSRQTSEPTERGLRPNVSVRIPKSKLLAELADIPPKDKTSKDHREQWALQVSHVIDRRTGLLVPEGGDSFTMPYKLQEFLAGEHLTDGDQLDAVSESLKLAGAPCGFDRVVAQLVGSTGYWEEVVKWAAAIQAHVKGSKGEARDLALELCDAPAPADATTVRRAVVAGEILWEVGVNEVVNTHRKYGPECLTRVRETLDGFMRRESLTPQQRATAGSARGWLEDLPAGVGLAKNELPDIQWIEIPSGKFRMGGKESWQGGQEFGCELIKASYRISRYPVTVRQYQAFADSGGYGEPYLAAKPSWWTDAGWAWRNGMWCVENWPDWAREHYREEKFPILRPQDFDSAFQTPNHPRVGVSWFEAVAFCRWLNEKLKLKPDSIRLPSEAEWERAARGANGRAWPWKGDETDLEKRCNCRQSGIGHTSAVGLFPAGDTPLEGRNQSGIADLAGNVWEWCRTQWLEKNYKNYESRACDDLEGDHGRVVRGGSWVVADSRNLFPVGRYCDIPGNRGRDIGFRLVLLGGSAE